MSLEIPSALSPFGKQGSLERFSQKFGAINEAFLIISLSKFSILRSSPPQTFNNHHKTP
jgi:hypothetical protein